MKTLLYQRVVAQQQQLITELQTHVINRDGLYQKNKDNCLDHSTNKTKTKTQVLITRFTQVHTPPSEKSSTTISFNAVCSLDQCEWKQRVRQTGLEKRRAYQRRVLVSVEGHRGHSGESQPLTWSQRHTVTLAGGLREEEETLDIQHMKRLSDDL